MENFKILSKVYSKSYDVKSAGQCIKCKSREELVCNKKFCVNWIQERKINV